MEISIVGSGNAATVLGTVLKQNNHTINEVAGRNKDDVTALALQLNAKAQTDLSKLSKESDVYIIAVKDDAVAEVSSQLDLDEKIVVHTCGSVLMNVLKNASSNIGVLYPLQTLRKELLYEPVIPFLIDGNNEFTKKQIQNLAASISSNVIYADDEKRLQYHLAAIMVSNFSNHLFALAKQYCDAGNIHFDLLLPLLDETVNRLHYFEPAVMQTGPAARGDQSTMQKHLELLEAFPQLKYIYEVMSESIINFKR